MPWPLSQDYNEAIQNPAHCFTDPELRQAQARCNAIGLPMPYSGNFADVYELGCPGGKRWAVKCFTRQVPGLRERYAAISAYLKQVDLPFMVDVDYLDPGINVRGLWYLVLKMDWVGGFFLNGFIKQHADNPPVLEVLCPVWVRLARRLREMNLAHADLQHGNVLLVPGANVSPSQSRYSPISARTSDQKVSQAFRSSSGIAPRHSGLRTGPSLLSVSHGEKAQRDEEIVRFVQAPDATH